MWWPHRDAEQPSPRRALVDFFLRVPDGQLKMLFCFGLLEWFVMLTRLQREQVERLTLGELARQGSFWILKYLYVYR